MKRFFFMISVLGIVTTNSFAADMSQEKKEAAKKVIVMYGYTCNYVNSMSSFITSNGYNVYCDDFSYGYEIENKGGRWSVTVK
ncbi:MAG: hypothetical protein M0Q02_07585 [Candidatus Muirbacterium halophilum]|nr:hypothetical protein [Candidatus Muirbacterium halophilum]